MECHHYGRALDEGRRYTSPMGLRIKELREARGWTQEELAERSHMSRSQLAMIEKETRPANTRRLSAIAAALGVPPEGLFDAGTASNRVIDLFVKLGPEDQMVLLRMAEALAAKREV